MLKFVEHEDVSRFKRMVGYENVLAFAPLLLLLFGFYVDVWYACAPNPQFNSSKAIFLVE